MEVNRAEKYNVKICRKEIIAAAAAAAEAKSLKERFLSLSNMDLLIPQIDVGVFFCYRKPPPLLSPVNNFSSMVAKLKSSLAKALVVFYPFAGEVVVNTAGELELLCNNRGVEFIEAYADVRLDQLDFYDVDGTVERKLLPKKEAEGGVLTLQATEMKCGGMILGCSFDHRISDAYTFNMFIIAWAEMAADAKELSIGPIFDRSLLRPRQVDKVRSLEHALKLVRLYVPISNYSPPPPPSTPVVQNPDPPTINRIYYIVSEEIDRLQSSATSNGLHRRTKLESFTAYLWKLIAQVGKPGQVCRMGVVVDGRRRLGPSEMNSYFGNVVSISYSSLGVEEVEGMGIEELADVVHQFVAEVDKEEHFRGLVDWVEERKPDVCVSKIYIEEGISVVVSSGRRFPIVEVDFGWGNMMLGSYHFPWAGKVGYVMPMPMSGDKGKDGDWLVYVHLLAEIVEVLETVGAGVFRPITNNYLFSSQK